MGAKRVARFIVLVLNERLYEARRVRVLVVHKRVAKRLRHDALRESRTATDPEPTLTGAPAMPGLGFARRSTGGLPAAP